MKVESIFIDLSHNKGCFCSRCKFSDCNPEDCATIECARGTYGYYKNVYENEITEYKVAPQNPLDTQVGGGHYKSYVIQPVEFCQKNQLNYCESNIVKYACRHRDKGGVEDLKKVIHYAQLLIELEYNKNEK